MLATTAAAPAVKVFPEPPDLPEPLPEPGVDELRLETVLGALSDPLRLTIVRKLLLESENFDHSCGWFGFDRPKSSLTHHFKALREAGSPASASTGSSAEARSGSTTSMPGSPASSTWLRPGPRRCDGGAAVAEWPAWAMHRAAESCPSG